MNDPAGESEDSQIENCVLTPEAVDDVAPNAVERIQSLEDTQTKLAQVVAAQGKLIEQSVTIEQLHSGPLPHPATFRAYEDICPGAAARILTMAESEQKHRHHMDRKSVGRSWGGLYIGGFICTAVSLGGLVLIARGQSPQGMAAFLAGLAPIFATFFGIRVRVARKAKAEAASSEESDAKAESSQDDDSV